MLIIDNRKEILQKLNIERKLLQEIFPTPGSPFLNPTTLEKLNRDSIKIIVAYIEALQKAYHYTEKHGEKIWKTIDKKYLYMLGLIRVIYSGETLAELAATFELTPEDYCKKIDQILYVESEGKFKESTYGLFNLVKSVELQ